VLACDVRIAVRREVCYKVFALNRGLQELEAGAEALLVDSA
jgi:hypothetical protein